MKEENAISDGESEIVNLMNKIEYMKKERSVLWLREFKEWMDQLPDYAGEGSQHTRYNLDQGSEKYLKQKGGRLLGEWSVRDPGGEQGLEDDNSSNVFESFTDTHTSRHGNGYLDTNGKIPMEHVSTNSNNTTKTELMTEEASLEGAPAKLHSRKPQNLSFLRIKTASCSSSLTDNGWDQLQKISSAPSSAIDEIMGSRPSSTYPGSPPHYQEDLLQRRLCLEEEFLQLSAESQSLASSDSATSSSEDDTCSSNVSVTEVAHLTLETSVEHDVTDRSTRVSQKNSSHEGRCERQCLSPKHDNQNSCNGNSDDASSSPIDYNLGENN